MAKVREKIICRAEEGLQARLGQSPAAGIHTAFVEWQNRAMRCRNRRFTRKSLSFSSDDYPLDRKLHPCVGYWHF